ncbi:Nucleoside ABC transporter, periplasmic nucleoside-binding protein [Pseudomonas synxantha]|nr:Nucleoside ABC transporter, periplasmic nucleoside-binding protein [Pseudomonas synxantha]
MPDSDHLRDTTGLIVDYAAKTQINFLNGSEVSSNHPEIWALRAVDKRDCRVTPAAKKRPSH